MALNLYDITVEFDQYSRRYRLQYKDSAYIMERHIFDHMYDTYDSYKLYNFLKKEYFGDDSTMMFDEYYGSVDTYRPETAAEATARMKAEKVKQFENKERNKKQQNKNALNGSFWGMLLVQDILDGNA